jgi:hypothetical protein
MPLSNFKPVDEKYEGYWAITAPQRFAFQMYPPT